MPIETNQNTSDPLDMSYTELTPMSDRDTERKRLFDEIKAANPRMPDADIYAAIDASLDKPPLQNVGVPGSDPAMSSLKADLESIEEFAGPTPDYTHTFEQPYYDQFNGGAAERIKRNTLRRLGRVDSLPPHMRNRKAYESYIEGFEEGQTKDDYFEFAKGAESGKMAVLRTVGAIGDFLTLGQFDESNELDSYILGRSSGVASTSDGSIPFTLGNMSGGISATLLGTFVGGPVGTSIGASTFAAGAYGGTMMEYELASARGEHDYTTSSAITASMTSAAIEAATEKIGLGVQLAIGRAATHGVRGASKTKTWADRVSKFAEGGPALWRITKATGMASVTEAGEEAIGAILSNTIRPALTNEEMNDFGEIWEDVKHSAIHGAVGGAVYSPGFMLAGGAAKERRSEYITRQFERARGHAVETRDRLHGTQRAAYHSIESMPESDRGAGVDALDGAAEEASQEHRNSAGAVGAARKAVSERGSKKGSAYAQHSSDAADAYAELQAATTQLDVPAIKRRARQKAAADKLRAALTGMTESGGISENSEWTAAAEAFSGASRENSLGFSPTAMLKATEQAFDAQRSYESGRDANGTENAERLSQDLAALESSLDGAQARMIETKAAATAGRLAQVANTTWTVDQDQGEATNKVLSGRSVNAAEDDTLTEADRSAKLQLEALGFTVQMYEGGQSSPAFWDARTPATLYLRSGNKNAEVGGSKAVHEGVHYLAMSNPVVNNMLRSVIGADNIVAGIRSYAEQSLTTVIKESGGKFHLVEKGTGKPITDDAGNITSYPSREVAEAVRVSPLSVQDRLALRVAAAIESGELPGDNIEDAAAVQYIEIEGMAVAIEAGAAELLKSGAMGKALARLGLRGQSMYAAARAMSMMKSELSRGGTKPWSPNAPAESLAMYKAMRSMTAVHSAMQAMDRQGRDVVNLEIEAAKAGETDTAASEPATPTEPSAVADDAVEVKPGEAVGDQGTLFARGRRRAAENDATTSLDSRDRPGRQEANEDVRAAQSGYMTQIGSDDKNLAIDEYVPVDIERAKRIADEFELLPEMDLSNPEVRESYQAMADETIAQYDYLIGEGYTFTPMAGEGEPYQNSKEMLDELRADKHIRYFKTNNPDDPVSFGSGESKDGDHPLLRPAGGVVKDTAGNDHVQVVNDLFRAVHDVFGHGAEGAQFGPRGEENAWRKHATMFSDKARRAMTTETRGQNSWVNYGPHLRRDDGSVPTRKDPDFVPSDNFEIKKFADQKVALLPEWASTLDAREGAVPSKDMLKGVGRSERRRLKSAARMSSRLELEEWSASEWIISMRKNKHAKTLTIPSLVDATAVDENGDPIYHIYRIPGMDAGYALKRVREDDFDGYEATGLASNEKGVSGFIDIVIAHAISRFPDMPIRLDAFDVRRPGAKPGEGFLPYNYRKNGFIEDKTEPYGLQYNDGEKLAAQIVAWQADGWIPEYNYDGKTPKHDGVPVPSNLPDIWYGKPHEDLTEDVRRDVAEGGLSRWLDIRESLGFTESATTVGGEVAVSDNAQDSGVGTTEGTGRTRQRDQQRDRERASGRAREVEQSVLADTDGRTAKPARVNLAKLAVALKEEAAKSTLKQKVKMLVGKELMPSKKWYAARDKWIANGPRVQKTRKDGTTYMALDRSGPEYEAFEKIATKHIRKFGFSGEFGDITRKQFQRFLEMRTRAAMREITSTEQVSEEEVRELIATALAEEIIYAFDSGEMDATDWYAENIREMFEILGRKRAELHSSHPDAEENKIAFSILLAVMSNGQDVVANMKIADKAFDHYLRTGELPKGSEGYRDAETVLNRMRALIEHFQTTNPEAPWAAFDAWLQQDGTTSEINARLNEMSESTGVSMGKLSGELATSRGWNSFVLGSKLGSFYLNLRGNFDPLTMDIWWMRSIGRLVGTLMESSGGTERSFVSKAVEMTTILRKGGESLVNWMVGELETGKSTTTGPSTIRESEEAIAKIEKRLETLRLAGRARLDRQIVEANKRVEELQRELEEKQAKDEKTGHIENWIRSAKNKAASARKGGKDFKAEAEKHAARVKKEKSGRIAKHQKAIKEVKKVQAKIRKMADRLETATLAELKSLDEITKPWRSDRDLRWNVALYKYHPEYRGNSEQTRMYEYDPSLLDDPAKLAEWAATQVGIYASDKVGFKEPDPVRKAFITPAKGWHYAKSQSKDAPASGSDRAAMRSVMEDAVAIANRELKKRGLPTLNNASGQALEWYFEKGIYHAFIVGQHYGPPGEQDFARAADTLNAREGNVADQTETPEFKAWFGDSEVVDEDGKPLLMYHGTKKEFTKFKPRFDDGLLFFTSDPKFASDWMRGTGGVRQASDEVIAQAKEMRVYENSLYEELGINDIDINTDVGMAEYDQIRQNIRDRMTERHGIEASFLYESSGGIRVMPVYLSVQKLFDPRKHWNLIELSSNKPQFVEAAKRGAWVVYENKETVDQIKALGFDGIRLSESTLEGSPLDTIAVFNHDDIKSATGNEGTFRRGDDATILNAREGDPIPVGGVHGPVDYKIATALSKSLRDRANASTDPVLAASLRAAAREITAEAQASRKEYIALRSKKSAEQKAAKIGYRAGLAVGRERLRDRMEKVKSRTEAEKFRNLKIRLKAEERASRRAVMELKRELLEIRRAAIASIMLLPMEIRGRFLNRAFAAKSLDDVTKISEEVLVASVKHEAKAARTDIKNLKKRLRKRGMTNETRKQVKKALDAATDLLTGDDGGLIKLDSITEMSKRIQLVRDLAESAIDIYQLDRSNWKERKEIRRERLRAHREEAAANMRARSPNLVAKTLGFLKGDRVTSVGKSPNKFTEMIQESQDADGIFETIEGEGSVLKRYWNRIRNAKSRMWKSKNEIEKKVEAALQRAGYSSKEDFLAKTTDMYGENAAEIVSITLGGEDVTMTLSEALSLAAIDDETMSSLPRNDADKAENGNGPGIVFRSRRDRKKLPATQEEIEALREILGPEHMQLIQEIKDILDSEIRDDAFQVHYDQFGRMPPVVENYWPRARRRSDIGSDLTGPDPASLPSVNVAGNTTLDNAGFFNKRTGGNAALVVAGLFDVFDYHVSEALSVIHLSRPLREFDALLRDEGVSSELAEKIGDSGVRRIREMLAYGVGLTGTRVGSTWLDKVQTNVAGAVLVASPETWGRMLGGAFRMMSEMPLVAWTRGVSNWQTLTPVARGKLIKEIESESGYFQERHQRSQVGRYSNLISDPKVQRQFLVALHAFARSMKNIKQNDAANAIQKVIASIQASGQLGLGMLSVIKGFDHMLRAIDRQIMVIAVKGHMAEGLTLEQAVQRAEMTFRRTQNTSDKMDDTMYAARTKGNESAWRAMLIFSSDPLKAYNQIRHAGRNAHEDPARVARTAAAIGLNSAMSVGIGTAVSAGLFSLFDDDEDWNAVDREIQKQMMMDREIGKSKRRLLEDVVAQGGGVVGWFFSSTFYAAEQILDGGYQSSDPVEVMALSAASDAITDSVKVGKRVLLGDDSDESDDPEKASKQNLRLAMSVGTVLGIPIASPVRLYKKYEEASGGPDIEKVLTELRSRKKEGGQMTREERMRLAQLEWQVTQNNKRKRRGIQLQPLR